MIDRYLFRGKRTNGGDWVNGYLGPHNKSESTVRQWYIVVHVPELDYHYSTNIDPNTIGQYTGLRDMTGTLIFEGDIVLGTGCAGEMLTEAVVYDAYGYSPFDYIRECDVEVVGNIHDNPELLKEART